MSEIHQICVCICTYKRPELLARLLSKLEEQETEGLFDYAVVIVDNDAFESARHAVETCARQSRISLSYYVEAEQNIAMARNKAVENAKGEFVAFIDDDELPSQDWLLNLYKLFTIFDVDGVLGPVIPYYETPPPEWSVRGKFFDRPSHKTGEILPFWNTRTGNVLLKSSIFDLKDNLFKQEFGRGSEDTDFFMRMINKGCRFIWCAEAPVYELVPVDRLKRSFLLKRALLRGKAPIFTHVDILKSVIAIPLYTLALPGLFLIGQHLFMKYLIKNCDHIGRVLAFLGMDIVREKYVS